MEKAKASLSKPSPDNMPVQLNTNIGIHYLTFTLFQELTENLNELSINFFNMPLSSFYEVNNTRNYYKKRYVYKKMISINVDGLANNRNTIHFEITGKGCEMLGYNMLMSILQFVNLSDGNITRFDIHFDDFDNILSFKKIAECVKDFKNRVKTSFKFAPEYRTKGNGESYTFGEKSSNTRIIIYNKGIYEAVNYSWIRVEMRLYNKRVIKEFISKLFNWDEVEPQEAFIEQSRQLLRGYLDFLEPGEKNKYNRKSERFWAKFLENEPKLKLGVKKPVAVDDEQKQKSIENHIKSAIKNIGKERFISMVHDVIGELPEIAGMS